MKKFSPNNEAVDMLPPMKITKAGLFRPVTEFANINYLKLPLLNIGQS